MKKKQLGITLIALVITIIILLILSGIAIASLTNSGLFDKAKESKKVSIKSQAEEEVKLAVSWLVIEESQKEMTQDEKRTELETELKKSESNSTVSKSGTGFLANHRGYNFEIDEEYQIVVKENGEITAKVISEAEDKSKYYGATVTGYTCENNAGVNAWKIFYADENNIYLITDDYVSSQYIPDGKNGSEIYINSTNYDLSFNNVVNDYTGLSDISDDKIKILNNDYFEKGYSLSDDDNNYLKAVSYMLDTEVWKVFSNEKAEYAIGGPSIELFLKSYNQKYNTNYSVLAYNDGYLADAGYELTNEDWGESLYGSYAIKYHDELYSIANDDKANGMWMASPAIGSGYTSNYNGLMIVTGTDYMRIIKIDGSNANYNIEGTGFRPVVCLKSTVSLIDNGDGTFLVK